MRAERVQGVILKRTNFSEADKIVTVLTLEKGKIKALAKGIRRIKSRRAPHLELFNTVQIMLHEGRAFPTITEAQTLKSPHLDLKAMGYWFYISEVLDKLLPENEPHPEIYQKLDQNFDEGSTKKFTIEVLWNLGFLPTGDYPKQGVTNFVESITESPIKSKKFLEEI